MNNEDYYDYPSRGGFSVFSLLKVALGLFSLVFLPSVLIGWVIYYILFRQLRLRIYISTPILILSSLVFTKIFKAMGVIPLSIESGLAGKLVPYLAICLLIGHIVAFFFIVARVWGLKNDPELRQIKGWAYQFEYAPTPLDSFLRKKVIKSLENGDMNDYEKSPLGVLEEAVRNRELEDLDSKHTKPKVVYRYYDEALMHTLLSGGTGAGKSFSMYNMIYNDIITGKPVCVIDFKKSPEFIYFLSKWAKENDRKFYHFTSGRPGEYRNPYLKEQSTYDPLSTGSATSKADMVLNLRTWDTSSEVFKQRTQDILQSVFFLLERTPKHRVPGIEWDKGGLAQVVSALNISNLQRMIEVMSEDAEQGLLNSSDMRRYNILINFYDELSGKKNTGLKDQVNELLSICRTLIVSSYGDWLTNGEDNHIDLLDISMDEKAPIVLFSFNPQDEKEFAKYMGNIVMSDINRVSAEKNRLGNKNYFGVYIDEFQTLDPESVTDLLEKARSARIFITLSVQSFEQIIKSASKDGEAALNGILDTCSNFLIHNGAGYDSSERLAKIVGKVDKYIYRVSSKMSSGAFTLNLGNRKKAMVSKDIEKVWLIDPSEIQYLQSPSRKNNFKSVAYLITKTNLDENFDTRGALGRKVHVVVNKDILGGMPEEFRQQLIVPKFEEEVLTNEDQIAMNISPNEDYDGGWSLDDLEEIDLSNQSEPITQQASTGLPTLKSSIKDNEKVIPRASKPKTTSFDAIKQQSKQSKKKDEEISLPKL